MTVATSTFYGVPIARTGEHSTLVGDGAFTRADLADAVAASKDPMLRGALDGDPPGFPGHFDEDDPQAVAAAQARTDEVSFGHVRNLRTTDDGDTLVADLADVPYSVPHLYPRRSIQGRRGVTGTAGRVYGLAVTGLGYLGRTAPAVAGMRRLDEYVRAGFPSGEPVMAAAGAGDEPLLTDPADTPPEARVETPTTYRVEVPVRLDGREIARAVQTVAGPAPTPSAETTTHEEPAMADPETPAEGEPEKPAAEATDPKPATEQAPKPEANKPESEATQANKNDDEPKKDDDEPELVQVPKADLEALQAEVSRLTAAEAERAKSDDTARKGELVSAARADGRIGADTAARYTQAYAERPSGELEHALGLLQPGVVPVAPIGQASAVHAAAAGSAAATPEDDYGRLLSPAERKRAADLGLIPAPKD